MISQQKQFQSRKSGFSFIEVLITVTIIGIITAVTIPNYTHYVTKNDQLLAEQKAIILQEEVFERIVYLSTTTSTNLPYVSNSNHGGVGVLDIGESTLMSITNSLFKESSVVLFENKEKVYFIEATSLSYGGWEVECLLTYDTGEQIQLFFEVRDDQYSYHDTAFVNKFIYTTANGIKIEKSLVL